jgi:hypothetical protein
MAYTLGNIPSDAPAWLVNELRKLQEAMSGAVDYVVFNPLPEQPKKLKTGLTVLADGVNWDPLTLATGEPYKVCYYGGAWHQDA